MLTESIKPVVSPGRLRDAATVDPRGCGRAGRLLTIDTSHVSEGSDFHRVKSFHSKSFPEGPQSFHVWVDLQPVTLGETESDP